MDILRKIRPTKIVDFIGSKLQIRKISEILSDIDHSPTPIICMIGPTGCGKSLACELLLAQFGFEVLDIKAQSVNGSDINVLIRNFLSTKSIEFFFNRRQKIVYIDDVDVLLTTERNIIAIVAENIELVKSANTIFLMTCKTNEEKKLLTFKNNIGFVRLYNPNPKDTFVYLMNCEHVNIPNEELLDIVNKHRGNIRDTVLNVHSSIIERERTYVENTFKNLSNFEIVKSLLTKSHSNEEIDHLLKNDTSLMSFMLYENIPEELYHNRNFRSTGTTMLRTYLTINEFYSTSCDFEEYMYNSFDWNFVEYIARLRLMGITTELRKLPQKVRKKDNKLRYSQMLSKISHKNIMNKKIEGILFDNQAISYIELLYIINAVDEKLSIKSLKTNGTLTDDELNLINTYTKYFSS